MKEDKFYHAKNGFSLIEMLIIIAIIGTLASIVLSNVRTAKEKAKIARAKQEVRQIYNAITLLETDTEEWPGHQASYVIAAGKIGNEICPDGCNYPLSDCMAGIICNPGFPDNYFHWGGPYMSNIPEDPWGNEYFFDTDYDIQPGPGEKWAVVIGSYGPNGQGDNQYDDDDIIYTIISE